MPPLKPGIKAINIELSADQHRALKVYVARHGTSIQALVTQLIETVLASEQAQTPQRAKVSKARPAKPRSAKPSHHTKPLIDRIVHVMRRGHAMNVSEVLLELHDKGLGWPDRDRYDDPRSRAAVQGCLTRDTRFERVARGRYKFSPPKPRPRQKRTIDDGWPEPVVLTREQVQLEMLQSTILGSKDPGAR